MKSPFFPLINVLGTISVCTFFLWRGGTITAAAAETGLDTAKIESITGLKGMRNEKEDTFKVSKPRSDVAINVDQARLAPFMGFTSWAAFTPGSKDSVLVMGDMVLFEDEVNPVMSVALDKGLEVTALHNHFFFDEPKVYFMHIGGEGSTEQLAKGVRAALDAVKQVRAGNRQPGQSFAASSIPAKSSITANTIQDVLGAKGEANNGMFKAVFGRTVKMPCGCEVGKEMGVNAWAAFAGSDDNAVVDGDFVVLEDELQPTLKSLRKSGINIVAIHHHMIGEEPRVIFFHYWGRGLAKELAVAVKIALQTTKTVAAPK